MTALDREIEAMIDRSREWVAGLDRRGYEAYSTSAEGLALVHAMTLQEYTYATGDIDAQVPGVVGVPSEAGSAFGRDLSAHLSGAVLDLANDYAGWSHWDIWTLGYAEVYHWMLVRAPQDDDLYAYIKDKTHDTPDTVDAMVKMGIVYRNPSYREYFSAGIWDTDFIARCVADGIDPSMSMDILSRA